MTVWSVAWCQLAERLLRWVRAPRGPAELVHIARRLLEDAADQCRESGPRAMRTEDARALAVLHGAIDVALHALPDPDAEAA